MTLQMYKRLSLFAIHFEKNNRKKSIFAVEIESL